MKIGNTSVKVPSEKWIKIDDKYVSCYLGPIVYIFKSVLSILTLLEWGKQNPPLKKNATPSHVLIKKHCPYKSGWYPSWKKLNTSKHYLKKCCYGLLSVFRQKSSMSFAYWAFRVGNSQYQQLFYRARYLLHLFLVDIDPLQDRLDT